MARKLFEGYKKLKTVTVKSSKIKSIGKSAFKSVSKSAKIKVPSKKLTSYKKLFLKRSGLAKRAKVVKK